MRNVVGEMKQRMHPKIERFTTGCKALGESKKRQLVGMLAGKEYVSGITVIELVLILVIIIALLVIFKEQLIDLLNTIFEKITSESCNSTISFCSNLSDLSDRSAEYQTGTS